MKAILNKPVALAKRAVKPVFKLPILRDVRRSLAVRRQLKKMQRDPVIEHYLANFDSIGLETKRVMFDSFWGRKAGCHPYAIYRAMRHDERFQDFTFVWVANDPGGLPKDIKMERRAVSVHYASKEYAEELLRCGTIITNTTVPGYFTKRKGQNFATTWHGIPIKTLGRESDSRLVVTANTHRNFNISDTILMAGPYAREYTITRGYYAAIASKHVVEVGSPRIDLSINTSKQEVLESLGLDPNAKIILYAPTWRGPLDGVSSDIKIQLAAIQALEEKFGAEYEIFVSLHHLTIDALKKTPTDVRLVPSDTDVNVFMAAVDIMVSDYSSIFVDFLALDRPTVLYVPDLAAYEHERGLYVPLSALPVAIATTTEELVCAIAEAKVPSSYEQYKFVQNDVLPYEDGNASQRSIQAIFFAEKNPEQSERKRIVIYGGGLQHNGITSALVSLLENLDHRRYETFLAVDGYALDKEPAFRRNLKRIPAETNILVRNGQVGLKVDERLHFAAYRAGRVANLDRDALRTVFSREHRRLFGDQKFDIAIDYSGYSAFWNGLFAYSETPTKVVYQHNDLWAESRNKTKKHVGLKSVFFNYAEMDSIVAVSPELMEHNRERIEGAGYVGGGWTAARNLITPSALMAKASRPLSLNLPAGHHFVADPDVFKFIHIGRFSSEKNHARLIRAFASLVKEDIDAVLFLVGSGPLLKASQTLVRRLGIGSRVIFCGQLQNPMPLLSKADALVLSSNYEGQPIVLLEAMTLGKLCVSTRLPSTEAMLSGGRGVLVDKSIRALAEGMMEAYDKGESLITNQFSASDYIAEAMQEFVNTIERPAS